MNRILRLSVRPGLALLLAACLALFFAPVAARAAGLKVVTTTEDLAAIAREVLGDRGTVTSISHGYQDPHFVDAKPSYMVLLQKADLFVEVGRELEVGWAPTLVNGARNPKILPGAAGHVDASSQVQVIEVPASVSRSQGDIHPFGNPHYWLDPMNGVGIARAIRDGLVKVDGAGATVYAARCADFEKRLTEANVRWQQKAAALGLNGMKIVTYHRSWSYFAKAFGMTVVDYVEPKPGIPPSPSHLAELEAGMKQGGVRLLLMEPYFDEKIATKVCKDTGVPLANVPSSVGSEPAIKTFFDLFDRDLAMIGDALAGAH